MIGLLAANPLLLVFLVAALGYSLGRLRWGGASLGISAVLFVGLAFGAVDRQLAIPELFTTFGLTLFVYTIGLSSGSAFFATFRRKGIAELIFVLGILAASGLLTWALSAYVFSFDAPAAAGLFTGSLNNTPSLAAVLDLLKRSDGPGAQALPAAAVVAYSIAYPFGVLGTIFALSAGRRLWGNREPGEVRPASSRGKIVSRTVLINRPGVAGARLVDLARQNGWDVVFARIKHEARQSLVTEATELRLGDLLVLVGEEGPVQLVIDFLGELAPEDLSTDRSQFDYRRVFVSSPAVFGRALRDLDFLRKHDAVITRVRRGDIDLLAHDDTVLEPGDRVRVLCRLEQMDEVSRYLGDSYKAVSEIDFLSFSIGLAAGILLGLVPVPLPGGVVFTLGMAGGPLVVGLILGRVFRTGTIVWALPFSATLMLRQIGLVLFLAGVGVRSGFAFFDTLLHGNGWRLFVAGALITSVTSFSTLWFGRKVLGIPFGKLSGMVAGIQTQPAVLGYALEQSGDEEPNTGYAMVHPVATIMKILLAQLILVLSSSV